MRVIKNPAWVYYLTDKDPDFDNSKVGKWMYFFSDEAFAAKVCKEAVESEVVVESKHSDKPRTVVENEL